jgi:hypothetical protein
MRRQQDRTADGTYYLTADGNWSAIAIKAAGDGLAIFDGAAICLV